MHLNDAMLVTPAIDPQVSLAACGCGCAGGAGAGAGSGFEGGEEIDKALAGIA